MSFMLSTKPNVRPPPTPKSNTYTEVHVRQRIPYIRKKVIKLARLVKKYKDDQLKVKWFNAHIDQLRKERRHILTHLPPSLQELYNANDINILGFEEGLLPKRQTKLIVHTELTWMPTKLKCQSITLKGLPCVRNATSSCGKFCKMHNPALSSVRKIKPLK